MTNCDKIQTIGTALQDNLNDRGVSCIFGNTSGKQTLLDMANLINSNNLLGLGDSVITIAASRPYLLSGEKTDLIVTLKNGVGTPLANKSITISDGTSSYSGITNSLGLFTLYDVTVSADTTFTATYDTVSDSCLVEYCDFVDYAVTGNKNTDWDNYSSRLTVATDTIGTTVSKGSSNGFYYVKNGDKTFTNCIIEFDIISCLNVFWYLSGQSSTTQNLINLGTYYSNGGHCKIIMNNGVAKAYLDGVQVVNDITITATSPYGMGFRINAGDGTRNIKYKNFRLHEI